LCAVDAPIVQPLAGNAAIADTTLHIPQPYRDGMAGEWIASHQPAYVRSERATFAVVAADELVGVAQERSLRGRVWSLTACLGACALGGMYASVRARVRMKRMTGYSVDAEDLAWHVVLPCIVYLLLLGSAVLVRGALEIALIGAAVVAVSLLIIGIHNAWDVAVFLVIREAEDVAGPAGDQPRAT
jgi:hypothetical protein